MELALAANDDLVIVTLLFNGRPIEDIRTFRGIENRKGLI